jgi:hypothetical protein
LLKNSSSYSKASIFAGGRKQKGFILAELFGMKKFMIPVYTYGWERDSSMGGIQSERWNTDEIQVEKAGMQENN